MHPKNVNYIIRLFAIKRVKLPGDLRPSEYLVSSAGLAVFGYFAEI